MQRNGSNQSESQPFIHSNGWGIRIQVLSVNWSNVFQVKAYILIYPIQAKCKNNSPQKCNKDPNTLGSKIMVWKKVTPFKIWQFSGSHIRFLLCRVMFWRVESSSAQLIMHISTSPHLAIHAFIVISTYTWEKCGKSCEDRDPIFCHIFDGKWRHGSRTCKIHLLGISMWKWSSWMDQETLPETNSTLPLKIGQATKGDQFLQSSHQYSDANCLFQGGYL